MSLPRDPARVQRITAKLCTLWAANPDVTLGALMEVVENVAWEQCPYRDFSARLMNLPDEWLEKALDHVIAQTVSS